MVYKRQQRPFVDRELVGKHGEEIVIKYFNDRGIKFEDVRESSQHQKDEIDFITCINGKEYTVEVKTSENNIYKYNSIMVKLHTSYANQKEAAIRGNDAWVNRTKADFIFYVCCKTNNIVILKTNAIKKCIDANLYTNLKPVTYLDREFDRSRARYDRKNTVVYIPLHLFKSGSIKKIKTNYKLQIANSQFSSKRQ